MSERFTINYPGLKHLVVLLASARFIERVGCNFVGKLDLPARTIIRLVQVMDRRSGVVVRRYAYVVDAQGHYSLRLRTPCLSGKWDVLDAQVSKVLGGAPVIACELTGLGALKIGGGN